MGIYHTRIYHVLVMIYFIGGATSQGPPPPDGAGPPSSGAGPPSSGAGPPPGDAANNKGPSYPSYDDVKRMKTDLFDGTYDSVLVPVQNQSWHIYIYVEFEMTNVLSVAETDETVVLSGYLNLKWSDEILTWDPAQYAGVTTTYFPNDIVWKPQLGLANAAETYELGNGNLPVYIKHTGEITWTPFAVFKLNCQFDVYFYPFDEHKCVVKLFVEGYTTWETQLNNRSNLNMDIFNLNSEWIVTASQFAEIGPPLVPTVIFRFELIRRPGYVVVTNIIPVILLSVLNLAVFMLPNNSGEKASYAITVFLSFAVLMTVILATFPRNATIVSVFARYLLLQTVQSTVIALIALLFVRLSSLGDEGTPVYPVLVRFVRIARRVVCRAKRKADNVMQITVIPADSQDVQPKNRETINVINEDKITWKEALNMCDKFCLIVFTILLIMSSVGLFVVVVFKL